MSPRRASSSRGPPEAIDLSRYATPDFLASIDPAIKHRRIGASEIVPETDPDYAHNRHPGRRWCEDPASVCIESRYQLEGKLPVGIRLANKLEEGGKQIADYILFQSELRVLSAEEADAGRTAAPHGPSDAGLRRARAEPVPRQPDDAIRQVPRCPPGRSGRSETNRRDRLRGAGDRNRRAGEKSASSSASRCSGTSCRSRC